jgi:hypothetical protein
MTRLPELLEEAVGPPRGTVDFEQVRDRVRRRHTRRVRGTAGAAVVALVLGAGALAWAQGDDRPERIDTVTVPPSTVPCAAAEARVLVLQQKLEVLRRQRDEAPRGSDLTRRFQVAIDDTLAAIVDAGAACPNR